MHDELSLSEIKKEYHGSLKSYILGFFLSLIFTLISFSLVVFEVLPRQTLIYSLPFLALIQAGIQLVFFLHLGKEENPKWESLVFYFMVLVLLIIVLGSLWIMYDLEARTMQFMEMK